MRMVLAFLLFLAIPAFAEVKDSGPGGFTVATSFHASGTPDQVFRKIANVGQWWNQAHTYSGDAHNLSIDLRPGGCWCEKLAQAGGGAMHMQVLTVMPGQLLVMSGGLGPLQQMGASGAMTFKLAKAETGTTVEFRYVVSVYAPNGMKALAPVVDAVLMDAMARLESYINTGNPATKK